MLTKTKGYWWTSVMDTSDESHSLHLKSINYRRVLITPRHKYCTIFGSLDHFWPPVVPYYATEDTVRIVNSFITIFTFVTTITHNYFLRCVTFTQLTIIHVRDYNHLLQSYSGWVLSYQLLSQIITHFTSSHFETLAEILLREFTS
jgi:hypothetical protein